MFAAISAFPRELSLLDRFPALEFAQDAFGGNIAVLLVGHLIGLQLLAARGFGVGVNFGFFAGTWRHPALCHRGGRWASGIGGRRGISGEI